MKNEADVKAAVKAIFKKHGVWYAMPLGQMYGKVGVPDFLACAAGQFLAVETKFDKRKPTPLQVREIEAIRGAGGRAVVTNNHNLAELEALVVELKHAGTPAD